MVPLIAVPDEKGFHNGTYNRLFQTRSEISKIIYRLLLHFFVQINVLAIKSKIHNRKVPKNNFLICFGLFVSKINRSHNGYVLQAFRLQREEKDLLGVNNTGKLKINLFYS